MKRSRFTEAQVIGILKEGEAGTKTAELARKHGVSEHTIYRWKAKYGCFGGKATRSTTSAYTGFTAWRV